MKNAILNYCNGKGITIEELAGITGVSVAQLYLINKDPMYNVTISTIDKIFTGTREQFGRGLSANEYLDFPCFEKTKRRDEK